MQRGLVRLKMDWLENISDAAKANAHSRFFTFYVLLKYAQFAYLNVRIPEYASATH